MHGHVSISALTDIVKQFNYWFVKAQEAERFAHFTMYQEQFLNLNRRNT